MLLRLLILAALVVLAPALRASAQVSPDDARRTLEVLQDPQKRDQLVTTLQTIAQAQQPAAPAPAASPIAPDSLGAEVLTGASGFLNQLSSQAIATVGAIRSVPQLWVWLKVMATNPWAQGILMDTAWRLALVLAVGIAAESVVRRVVQRPVRGLVREAPDGDAQPDEGPDARAESGGTEPPHRRRTAALILLRRVPLVLGRFVLELLPVLAFLAIGHLIVATGLGGVDPPRLILLAVIDAYALCAAILCIARVMLSPGQPRLRLLTVPENVAGYAMRWTRRIAVVSVFGYAIAEVGLLLGLSDAAHDAVQKAAGLVDHVFLGIIVLQQRRAVRRILQAPEGASGPLTGLRNWLARIWHWLALLLLATLWLTWAVEVQHGYTRMLRYFAGVIVVLVLARFAQIVILGALDRALSPRPDTASRYPGIEARLALYHPMLASVARALIFIVAALALLQLWGLGTFDWLVASALGRRLLYSLLSFAVTVLLSVAVWEAVNAAMEQHLTRLTREAQAARSARLRTLLPLLRTALAVVIVIVAGMMVLSEVGVNIGPLLAGAGIVGVAIGFGSQTLVRDLITGIFLLLENAMQVGDWVTVSGLSGTVENLSVRTIRLRAADGSVHIIPFSSVTTVTNVNRGLGNASVTVSVAAHEDTDRVCTVLNEIATGMRKEADFSVRMLSDLQLWGVDKLDGASATIAGQVVCTDSGRWSVQREFNRRMKQRFAELGIRLYNPMERMITVRQTTDEAKS
ncbi:MAG TPA: mechanosensitive ion channel domain-containing protein [Acetobacteraceae bacterium]